MDPLFQTPVHFLLCCQMLALWTGAGVSFVQALPGAEVADAAPREAESTLVCCEVSWFALSGSQSWLDLAGGLGKNILLPEQRR